MVQLRPLDREDDDRDLDDARLVAAVASGDPSALGLLVARHGSRIANFLSHVLTDRSWTDDLTQEVFVRLCAHAGRFDARYPLVVWLLRIARNLAIDLQRREAARRRAHTIRAQADADHDAPSADRDAEHAELRAAFANALQGLPEPFRTVFVLKEIELLSYAEIAEVIGSNEKTVSTRLHRARERMRTALTEFLGR